MSPYFKICLFILFLILSLGFFIRQSLFTSWRTCYLHILHLLFERLWSWIDLWFLFWKTSLVFSLTYIFNILSLLLSLDFFFFVSFIWMFSSFIFVLSNSLLKTLKVMNLFLNRPTAIIQPFSYTVLKSTSEAKTDG